MGNVDPKMLLLLFIVLLPLINTQMGQTGFTLGCLKPEREALFKFKASVVYDHANDLSSWKGDDCCSWYGVTCHNVTGHVLGLDLRGDEDYYYNGYDKPWDPSASPFYNYDYDIPWDPSASRLSFSELNPSLLELRQLRHLDLSGNDFNSSNIPKWIGSMKHLRYLNLSWGGFRGVVPPQLGNLTRLRVLDLHVSFKNSLPGLGLELSNVQWLSSLVNLRYLDINNIDITTAKTAHLLPQALSHLPLFDLKLSGAVIGNHFLSNLFFNSTLASRIQHLDLSWNRLKGSVPLFLSNMTSLKFLDLSFNELNGFIPLWFKSMEGLEFLSLSENSELYLPFSYVTLPSTIKHLDLSGINLKGQIPHILSNMTSLRLLDLSDSLLNCSIPLWLSNMKSLQYLDLSLNHFSDVEGGAIMGILGNLCHLKTLNMGYSIKGGILGLNYENFSNCITYDLEHLDLTNNNITDTLPYYWLGKLKNLKTLSLGDNRFYGPIPPYIGNLSSLELLDLRDCRFGGPIPSSIGGLSSLRFLFLNGNLLEGSIPTSLGTLSSLQRLDLASNSLQGVVSESHFANLSSLKELDLSFNALNLNLSWNKPPTFKLWQLHMVSCKIDNQFPEWIKMQNELVALDLSYTGIFGEISDWIIPNSLLLLNLSHNNIKGPIPRILPSSILFTIDLSYNLFSGPLFNESSSKNGVVEVPLCQSERLEILFLQSNHIDGAIPDCWGNSQWLYAFDLSNNNLSGTIPTTIGLLSLMVYLKLNNNSLQGTIPTKLSQLSNLLVLDLSENMLSGEVPHWDAESHPYLEFLIMRANQLEGVIPSKLCSLPRLQFLDLAINNLIGSIPQCFGQLESMKSLVKSNDDYDVDSMELPPNEPTDALRGQNAMVVLKGKTMQYTTILKLVLSLDLSSNGLVGSIPEGLTNLYAIIGLNLSNNHLTGNIPQKIGEMSSLESLDLSNNNISGTIPSSMSSLTSLSYLNLSSNMLHGKIPTGNQLQTLNDPTSYSNNPGLCGDPLPNKCESKHGKQQQQLDEEEEEVESTLEKVMFYIVVMLGFATGFWGVVGSLLYSRTWRHALFRRVEYVTDFLYVQVVVRIKRLKN